MDKQEANFWVLNEEPRLKHYFDMGAEAQRADHAFFNDNPGRTHLIREPYSDELREGSMMCAYLVVVRQHAPGTYERRVFQFRNVGNSKPRELIVAAHDEIAGRVLWATWSTYDYTIDVSIDVVNMAVSAMYAVMRLEPEI